MTIRATHVSTVGVMIALLCQVRGGTLHVAVNGSDFQPGTAAQPLASVAAAQRRLRELRQDPQRRGEPWTIELAGGTYYLAEPLTFTPEDSGSADAPVRLRTRPGEAPALLSGGVPLRGWRVQGGRWELDLPEVRAGAWRFSQLWVNGQRRFRPRVPADGTGYIESDLPPLPAQGPGHNRFRYRHGDVDPEWHNLHHVELLIFHHWSMSRIPVQEVNAARRSVLLAGRTWNTDIAGLTAGKRFIAENVREALDAPGEWYLDQASGLLTYIPMPGETPDTAEVVAPRLDQVVVLLGDAAADAFVDHLHFEDLVLAHTNWNVPEKGYCCAQAEVSSGNPGAPSRFRGAFQAKAARHCRVERCSVAHTGFYAIEFGEACRDNTVLGAELWDLGAGGVMLGTANAFPEGDHRIAGGQRLEECLIAHGGRLHPAAVGVWIGHSSDNAVVRNTIHDLYYTGISVGWRWSYGFSAAKRNLISHNHIYDIGQQRLSDLGGIYTLGESEGTVLSFNRIHDVTRVDYGGSGIYFDQASQGILVENNVVYRTQDATFNVHWGRENTVRNNIFADAREFQINPGRPDKCGPISFQRNIVAWSTGSPATRARSVREDFDSDWNLWWAADSDTLRFAGDLTFAAWQQTGKDAHSVVADPRFVDAASADFRLHPDSPAIPLGFVPFSFEGIGRSTPTRAAAIVVPAGFPVALPAPPITLHHDFEEFGVGAKPPGAKLYENNDSEVVRVSDERASSGSHALKMVDGPGDGPAYNPHFFYEPRQESGVLRGAFRVWRGAGLSLTHEWRTGTGKYRTGPSLRLLPDGALRAGTEGRLLTTLPAETWVHIEIICPLGDAPDRTFSVTVTADGEAPQHFAALPFVDAAFNRLGWYGWVAAGNEPAVGYLDDIVLHPAAEP